MNYYAVTVLLWDPSVQYEVVEEQLKFGADVMAIDSTDCQTLHISAKSRMLRSRA